MNSIKEKLLGDLLGFSISFAPIMSSIAFLYCWFTSSSPTLLKILLSPIILITVFCFSIFVIRLLIPKLKPGIYEVGFNKGFLTWYMHLSLNRSLQISHLKEFIYAYYFTRYLYFKAIGANIHYSVTTAINAELVDLQLITIKKGVTLSDDVRIAPHVITGDKLLLTKVTIGEGSFIGANSKIIGRTRIGYKCFIGPENHLYNKTIKENEVIDGFSIRGNS